MNINNSSQTKTELKTSEYMVTRVVDGDTVHAVDASGKEEILRFLAVDTLEKNSTNSREKCLADLQTKFTNDNLLNKQSRGSRILQAAVTLLHRNYRSRRQR